MAHRCVLASWSVPLRQLLERGNTELKLKEDPRAIQQAVDFMYGEKISFCSYVEAEAVLQFARNWKVRSLGSLAEHFLQSFLTNALADGSCTRELLLALHLLASNNSLHQFGQ